MELFTENITLFLFIDYIKNYIKCIQYMLRVVPDTNYINNWVIKLEPKVNFSLL